VEDREEFARFVCALPQIGGRYKTVEPLNLESGEGQNSLILRALDGRRPIILKVDLPWNNSYRKRAFEREYEILSRFKGEEGVVEVLGGMERIQLQVRAEQGGITLPYVIRYFPMEMARHDLAEVIYSQSERKTLLNKIILYRAACRSVSRLHRNSICHRDLKPSNLLIFGENNVKLGDLGTARQLGEGVQGILDTYDFPRGDVRYTAPELLCVTRECDRGFLDGDLYSLGAILFELVTGCNGPKLAKEVVTCLQRKTAHTDPGKAW
jgi:serine/threonine protein kinase